MYIRQGELFSYEEFVAERDDNTRLVLTLSALPDGGLLSWLRGERKGRRDEYPQEVLWRCLVAKYVYQIRTYAELLRELQRNGSLRRLVGIPSLERVPEAYHFSRLLKRLSSAEGLEQLRGMFEDLVGRLSEAMPEFGKHLAVDATGVHAYSNEQRRDKSDADAAWSARPKRQRRRQASGVVEESLEQRPCDPTGEVTGHDRLAEAPVDRLSVRHSPHTPAGLFPEASRTAASKRVRQQSRLGCGCGV